MPLILLPLILAVVFVMTVTNASLPNLSVVVPPPHGLQIHYTRSGVVKIDPHTGASRFVPYRLAGNFDRRSEGVVW